MRTRAVLAALAMPSALMAQTIWPDLVVGLAIALINAGAAREVWEAARKEQREAAP